MMKKEDAKVMCILIIFSIIAIILIIVVYSFDYVTIIYYLNKKPGESIHDFQYRLSLERVIRSPNKPKWMKQDAKRKLKELEKEIMIKNKNVKHLTQTKLTSKNISEVSFLISTNFTKRINRI